MVDKLKIEKRILKISLAGSIMFLLAEIAAAYFTGSHAVLMDCVFDIADLIMIGPFLVLVPLLYKPVTEKRPYGFSQVESLFVIIKCALLTVVTVQLIIGSVKLIINGGNEVNATAIAIFEIGVSISCIIMYVVLRRLNKRYSSPSIQAELYIWKLDAMSTMGVGLAFLVQLILQNTLLNWIVPYIDPGIAIILAALLLKEPLSMVWTELKNLVLFAPGSEITDDIRKISEECLKDYECDINFLDVIKTGRKLWVEIYIVPRKDLISVKNIKKAHDDIVDALKNEYDSIYVEIIPDIEKLN
ncbi:MAG: cation diffusion facilitator family transporter [Anaerovoracaceae bacterium]